MNYLYAHQQHSYCFPRVKYTRGLQSITAATTDVIEEPWKDVKIMKTTIMNVNLLYTAYSTY